MKNPLKSTLFPHFADLECCAVQLFLEAPQTRQNRWNLDDQDNVLKKCPEFLFPLIYASSLAFTIKSKWSKYATVESSTKIHQTSSDLLGLIACLEVLSGGFTACLGKKSGSTAGDPLVSCVNWGNPTMDTHWHRCSFPSSHQSWHFAPRVPNALLTSQFPIW